MSKYFLHARQYEICNRIHVKVYYINDELSRIPFADEPTYYTYRPSFKGLKEIAFNYLALFVMGQPRLPKPGVVLIKIESLVDVFVVEVTPSGAFQLRVIQNEAQAARLFGEDWAQYIMELPPTNWQDYEQGEAIDDDYVPNLDTLIKRTDLVPR